MSLILALDSQRKADFREFEASLVYTDSSRTAIHTQRNLDSKSKNNNKR